MHGIVLYTDGGTRPTNGHGGSGIHAYTWDSSIAYKGLGLAKDVLTPIGYEPKAQTPMVFSQEAKSRPELANIGVSEFMERFKQARVTATGFYDSAIPLGFGITNNVAELTATIVGMRGALKYHENHRKLDVIYIRSDSKYVIETVMDNMEVWAENGFTLGDGSPTKNVELVVQLLELARKAQDLGIYVGKKHVKGHADELGNDTADRFATSGVFMSMAALENAFEATADPETYWKSGNDFRHPLMTHRFMYFDNTPSNRERGVYYVGNQGREIDLVGKRESDGAYGVVRVKGEVLPVLESVIDKQQSLPNIGETVVMADLDAIHGDHYRFLRTLGGHYLRKANDHRNDLISQNKILITREYNPAMLAHRVYDNVYKLESILNSYLANQDNIRITDLTQIFYNLETVTKKEVTTTNHVIKEDMVVGMTHIDVPAEYFGENGGEVITEITRLTMGIDLPIRNAIRRLADLKPKISLVTWRIGVDFHNYAVVIDCEDAISIFAGMCSNLRITGATAVSQEEQQQRIVTERAKRLAKKAGKKGDADAAAA